VLAPAWLVGGLLLRRGDSLGYVAGTGMLLLGCMMFLGPVFALIFPAFYNDSPVDVTAIISMLVVGLICFIPFALFVRGVASFLISALHLALVFRPQWYRAFCADGLAQAMRWQQGLGRWRLICCRRNSE
jgi:hypothetical protein